MLKRPRAARFVAAVFFDIDNRMAEVGSSHGLNCIFCLFVYEVISNCGMGFCQIQIEDDHELPNVDLAYIALTGHKLTCEAKEQHTESCGGC